MNTPYMTEGQKEKKENGWKSRELFINLISKQSYNLLVGFFVCFKVLDVILITNSADWSHQFFNVFSLRVFYASWPPTDAAD